MFQSLLKLLQQLAGIPQRCRVERFWLPPAMPAVLQLSRHRQGEPFCTRTPPSISEWTHDRKSSTYFLKTVIAYFVDRNVRDRRFRHPWSIVQLGHVLIKRDMPLL